MGLREHLLDQHGWHENDEGFDTMDEADRVHSHNEDHEDYKAHSHCPEEGCDLMEATPQGDMNPECPEHGTQLTTQAQLCIICGDLVLTKIGDPVPACSTHGGTA